MRTGLARLAGAAVLALVVAVSVPAGAARAETYTFSTIAVEGNVQIEAGTVLAYARIPKGEAVTDGQLNEAVQRINASGLFATVEIVPSGDTVIIKVTENPTISEIAFEGNRKFTDEQLDEVIKSQANLVYSQTLVEQDVAALTEAYTAAGRTAARIEARIIDRGNNRVAVIFEVREGMTVEVNRLSFTGNTAFSDRRLRQVLESKQAGILRGLIQSDTFVADRIEIDKQLLIDFYRSRGYIDATITGVSSEFSEERDGVFLTFAVSEGLQYRFGQIGTVSEYEGVDAAQFNDVIRIRPGVVYSPLSIDTTITRMENLAVQMGLNFLAIEPRFVRNEADQTLDVAFVLTKGPRVFVERIDIEGNTTTLDKVIRRQFDTAEGDPFDPREIRQSAERVQALGFFATADVQPRAGSNEDQVILDVTVEEQPTGSLNFGASYSVSNGFGINIGLTEKNFLGRGQFVNIDIGTTSDVTNSTFTFIEPQLLDRDLKLKFSGWYTTSENANAYYSTQDYGLSGGLVFPLTPRSNLEIDYDISNSRVYDVSPNSSTVLQQEAARDWEITSAVGYTYSFDTDLSELDPLSSVSFDLTQNFAGLGGDITSVTTTGLASYERSLFNEQVDFLAQLEGGAVVTSGPPSRIVDRFTGNGEIRGFERNGWGPRDLTVPNQDALGGNLYWVARFETQFPLGLPEEYGIKGGLFYDIGSLWSLDNPGPADDSMHIRSSIGVTIFWDSVLGPLRLDFANALDKESYDETQVFDLSVSTSF